MITACSDWWHRTIATLCPRSYIPIPMKSSLTVHCGHLPHSAHRAKVRPRVREPRACITIACGDLRAQFPLRHDNSRRTRCHSERSAAYIACRPIRVAHGEQRRHRRPIAHRRRSARGSAREVTTARRSAMATRSRPPTLIPRSSATWVGTRNQFSVGSAG